MSVQATAQKLKNITQAKNGGSDGSGDSSPGTTSSTIKTPTIKTSHAVSYVATVMQDIVVTATRTNESEEVELLKK